MYSTRRNFAQLKNGLIQKVLLKSVLEVNNKNLLHAFRKVSSRDAEKKMLLTKEWVLTEPRKKLRTMRSHLNLRLWKFFHC